MPVSSNFSEHKVKTVIFPVAGLGTRFLPATKAIPKELLPVLDRPLIQFAMDEARAAGIERMVFVSHPDKGAIERYVRTDAVLCDNLRSKGKHAIADMLDAQSINPDSEDVRFVMQHQPLGLGHAVLCAAEHALPGPVAVVLPDDLILGGAGALTEMIDAYSDMEPGHLVATMQVAEQDVSKYGILSVTGTTGHVLQADGMVEKPNPAEAPSRQAVVGRYILDASIFDDLRDQKPGAGGEIQLTDAIARGLSRLRLGGFRFSGTRFDCGSKEGMLQATLAYAASHAEYRDVIDAFQPKGLAAE